MRKSLLLHLSILTSLAACQTQSDTCISDDLQCLQTAGDSVSACPQGLVVEIEDNHTSPFGNQVGHSLQIPTEDALDGVPQSYDIQGDSAHNHVFSMDEYEFDWLVYYGQHSAFTTTDEGHAHVLTVYCHENTPDIPLGPDAGL